MRVLPGFGFGKDALVKPCGLPDAALIDIEHLLAAPEQPNAADRRVEHGSLRRGASQRSRAPARDRNLVTPHVRVGRTVELTGRACSDFTRRRTVGSYGSPYVREAPTVGATIPPTRATFLAASLPPWTVDSRLRTRYKCHYLG